jgi:hypothetical protein
MVGFWFADRELGEFLYDLPSLSIGCIWLGVLT